MEFRNSLSMTIADLEVHFDRFFHQSRFLLGRRVLLQASEERQERGFLFRREAKTEPVALYRLIGRAGRPPAAGHVSRLETFWIKELFEAGDRAIVQQKRSIPDTAQ